jgi:MiaB-like tRNA modifying enzyme
MKFTICTLGCKVNTYESNVMKDMLINKGYTESNDEFADIYIINTCTVTDTSDKKSLKMVRQCIRKNENAIIIVCGCMTQVNPSLAINEGASIVIGNKYKSKIVDYIEQYLENKKQIVEVSDIMDTSFESMILNNFDRTRAFVKIEDGCENYCTYCIIPFARGKVRSKDPNMALEEITTLVKKGHKEIVLTGIHTGHYGGDLINYNFCNLLEDIIKIEGLERLRISSIEITEIDDEILMLLKNTSIIVDHLHIPLQSGSDDILKSMNRKYNKEYFIDKVNKIRDIRPDISLTTDLIVGFPGETEELFNETIETIERISFSKIHVFPFSLRKGTKAEEIANHIEDKIKKDRVRVMMNISKKLEIEYMKKFINKEIELIPEKYSNGHLIGHTGNYLLIKIPSTCESLKENIKAKIIEVDYPYCIAKHVTNV